MNCCKLVGYQVMRVIIVKSDIIFLFRLDGFFNLNYFSRQVSASIIFKLKGETPKIRFDCYLV